MLNQTSKKLVTNAIHTFCRVSPSANLPISGNYQLYRAGMTIQMEHNFHSYAGVNQNINTFSKSEVINFSD